MAAQWPLNGFHLPHLLYEHSLSVLFQSLNTSKYTNWRNLQTLSVAPLYQHALRAWSLERQQQQRSPCQGGGVCGGGQRR